MLAFESERERERERERFIGFLWLILKMEQQGQAGERKGDIDLKRFDILIVIKLWKEEGGHGILVLLYSLN